MPLIPRLHSVYTFSLLLIFLISMACSSSLSQTNNNDKMSEISQFIVQTIDKYDYTQKGVIPVKDYKNFLAEIFIGGLKISENMDKAMGKQSQKLSTQATILKQSQQQQQIPSELINLLHKACDQFSQKYRQKQFVDLQQFYMDLIKNFMEFLDHKDNKNKYQSVIDYFFGFVNANNQEIQGNQHNQENQHNKENQDNQNDRKIEKNNKITDQRNFQSSQEVQRDNNQNQVQL